MFSDSVRRLKIFILILLPHIQRTINDELPPPLIVQDKVTPYDQVINHYDTTTGSIHNFKHMGGVLSHPSYKKAPGSWRVHYGKDGREKVAFMIFSILIRQTVYFRGFNRTHLILSDMLKTRISELLEVLANSFFRKNLIKYRYHFDEIVYMLIKAVRLSVKFPY